MAFFNPGKYELIHLSRTPRKFNMGAMLQVENEILAPKSLVRILDVRVDSQLRWGEHVKKVTDKMKTQINALIQTIASTWRATLATARQIYNAVIRPVMVYGTAVWYSNLDEGGMATIRGRRPESI